MFNNNNSGGKSPVDTSLMDQKAEKKEKDKNKDKDKERELLESRSQPMRKYLMDKVIPCLAEGVLKICSELPEEPVKSLIAFLERKSRERIEEEKQKEEQKANQSSANAGKQSSRNMNESEAK